MNSSVIDAAVKMPAESPASLPASTLDLGWARWVLSLLVLPTLLLPMLGSSQTDLRVLAPTAAFGLLLAGYFIHLLLRRLQIGLLEWTFVIVLLGNLEGFLLTAPGVLSTPFFWVPLAPLLAVWILYASVMGVIQAELLQITSVPQHLLLITLQVLALASPSLLILAGILEAATYYPWIAGEALGAWKWPLAGAGVMGLGLRFWISRRTVRAAKAALENP